MCNNIDGPGVGSIILSKIRNRERQMPYDFIYMWNLKNKIMNKWSRNILIDTKNILMVARWEGRFEGMDEKGKGIENYRLVVTE